MLKAYILFKNRRIRNSKNKYADIKIITKIKKI